MEKAAERNEDTVQRLELNIAELKSTPVTVHSFKWHLYSSEPLTFHEQCFLLIHWKENQNMSLSSGLKVLISCCEPLCTYNFCPVFLTVIIWSINNNTVTVFSQGNCLRCSMSNCNMSNCTSTCLIETYLIATWHPPTPTYRRWQHFFFCSEGVGSKWAMWKVQETLC